MTAATDTLRTLTVDQRMGFLLELAEHVENESRWAHRPFTDAVPGIVPHVASALCPDPVAAFHWLVDALSEKRAFDGDPASYADAHDWACTSVALDRLHDRLQSEVDAAVQQLLGSDT